MVVSLGLAALGCGACSHDDGVPPATTVAPPAPEPEPKAVADKVVSEPQAPTRPPVPPAPVDPAAARKAKMLAEIVLRLRGTDLSADPDTRSMVEKALVANRGTATFVEIVEAFGLVEHDPELLQLAIAHATDSTGALAMRLVLDHGGVDAVTGLLAGADAVALVTAMGGANDQRVLPLLTAIVSDPVRATALRQAAVRAVSRFEAGAMSLLALCERGTMPADIRSVAVAVLNGAPWDTVRAEVRRLLPPPSAADRPLPPIPELAQLSGDAARGAKVFAGLCITCHRVGAQGIDYGPDLSAIGDKLGKDGLYTAVLYPDAGVEFNYETTLLELHDGNSAIGIVVSDTTEEVAIKAIGGAVTKYRVADIRTRNRQKSSSMPGNLQASLRQQDLVDLVEYLTTLRAR